MIYKCRVSLSKDEWISVIMGALSNDQRKLLMCVAKMPEHKASALELAELMEASHYSTINLMVGNLGKSVQKALSLPQPDVTHDAPEWWSYVFSGERLRSRKLSRKTEWFWMMADSLFEAVMELFGNDTDSISSSQIAFHEGDIFEITLTQHERNGSARVECIAHYKAICQICGFNFREFYGGEFENIIHVHHLEALANATDSRAVDPLRDLIPVCPNCHTVLHQKIPPYTPDELREKIFERSKLRTIL